VLYFRDASALKKIRIYQAQNLARIRVFHGTAVDLYFGDVCNGGKLRSIHAASGGFSYLVPNKTIGMPTTDDLPFSYHEYFIPAGKPLTVRMFWQTQNATGMWEHCGPIHVMFTPEAGQDYDTFMEFKQGVCQGVALRRFIMGQNGKVTTIPASINRLPFKSCIP